MNTDLHALSRRHFITRSGLAAAAVSMPHVARGQDAGGGKLRIGIIGCGGRSNSVGEMALKDGRFEIVALADYFQKAVDSQGEKFKVPADRRFTGLNCFKKLIEAGGIYNRGITENWKTFHDNITKGNYAQETVAPSVRSHYLALLAREACYRNGETVTWDEVVASKTAFLFDTTGLKS